MTEQFEKCLEWCLVANVISEQPFGENHEIQYGTKHFSPNTKVYCSAQIWGDGYDKIVVVGRHRGSSKLVRMVIDEKRLTNWRARYVYLPKLKGSFYMRSWDSKEQVEGFAKSIYQWREAKNARKKGFEKFHPNEVLIYALILDRVADVQQAIERGADVNHLSHDGFTPLTLALSRSSYSRLTRSYSPLTQFLLEKGADIKTISYQFLEKVTQNPSLYPQPVFRLVEQAIDELFPHSQRFD
ncbi:ankyrin repeat domain-containing protein [Nostoc sp.]|uniref:ankyrin repeat domain-containing protein n=1 Tax=Nostoc sp. TaxID=1180 RepID=UPI002FFB8DC3